MATECEVDRFSMLPDDILSSKILVHLPLRDVVGTSLLSRRWRFLWKQIPNLDFSEEFFSSIKFRFGRNRDLNQKAKYINDVFDNILLAHSVHIERFSIHLASDIMSTYGSPFIYNPSIYKGLEVDQCIRRAALKEVKHMSLKIPAAQLDIPPSLFECHSLRNLEIQSFRFRGIPIEFNGFQFLQSCSLSNLTDLSDDGVKQLVGLCPFLRKLVLSSCSQLINLIIQAPNLISLNIVYCYGIESLTANCPQLVELEIGDCDSLIQFEMNSCVLFHDLHTSDVQIPKELSMLNSLRKMSVKACPGVSHLTWLTTLGCFRNLEEVNIEIFRSQYLEQESAIADMVAGLTLGEVIADSTFPSLKKAYVDISPSMKKEEAIMLAFLLNNSPSLNTITINLPYCLENIHDKDFIDEVLDLQRLYEKVDIRMEKNEWRQDSICMDRSDDDLENDIFRSEYDLLNLPPGSQTLLCSPLLAVFTILKKCTYRFSELLCMS